MVVTVDVTTLHPSVMIIVSMTRIVEKVIETSGTNQIAHAAAVSFAQQQKLWQLSVLELLKQARFYRSPLAQQGQRQIFLYPDAFHRI